MFMSSFYSVLCHDVDAINPRNTGVPAFVGFSTVALVLLNESTLFYLGQ